MASNGYPEHYEKGYKIDIPTDVLPSVYVAGAALNGNNDLVTSGGRVLGVTALGETLEDAIARSYSLVEKIKFDNAFYRKDIGKRALMAKEKN